MIEQIERFPLGDGSGAMVVYADDYDNLLADAELLRKDAERYRWLREQTWDSAYLCVVVRPKEAVKLGHDCPSGDRLDTKIDAAMAYE